MDNDYEEKGRKKGITWKPKGPPTADGLRNVDLAIGKDEPILHGILRGSVEAWRRKRMTQKLAVALFIVVAGGALYYFYGLLVAVFVTIALVVVVPYEMFDAYREERKHIRKVRIYRPRGILKSVDVAFSRLQKKVETYVYNPDVDGNKPRYEEWFYSKDLTDPTDPKMVRLQDCAIIETGYSTIVFGIDVLPMERVIIGDKGNSVPVFDILPYIEETKTFVTDTMAKAKKELTSGELKIEDYNELHEKAENALMAFGIFEAFAHSKKIRMKKLGDLHGDDRKYVVAMDRTASEFFETLKQYGELEKMPYAIREAKFMSIINAETVQQQRIGFWQMHENQIRELSFAEAIDTEYALSSRAPEETGAFWKDYHDAVNATRTQNEKEVEQRGNESEQEE